MRRQALRNRGDTIIEVMIVLAVLGLAITMSYTTANRSLLATRQAQENARATQLLYSQIEQMRLLAAVPSPSPTQNIFRAVGAPFCVTVVSGVYAVLDTTAPACLVDNLYRLSITHTDNPAAGRPNTFTLTATWLDASGRENSTVTMNYRIHPT